MFITRKSLAAVGCALLIAASTACGTSETADAETRARRAVERLGQWEAVSVTLRVDAPADDIHAFLRHQHGRAGGTPPGRADARLLSRLELMLTFGTDQPLNDTAPKDRIDTAATVNLGGRDLAGYRSLGTDFYVRADWRRLAAELDGRHPTVARAAELAGSAKGLPPSLAAARDALKGRWVQIDPTEFDHFARAVGGKHGERAQRLANSVDLLQNASAQHHIVDAVRRALDDRTSFREARKGAHDGGTERIRVSLPARGFARELAAALGPLEERFDGIGFSWLERAPDRPVTADLVLRDGTLSGMTVDLRQFGTEDVRGDAGEDSGGPGELPLTLSFSPGQAVRLRVPEDTKWLAPQDVMAAVLYEDLGTPGP
ncbi:MAG TPA: hypothetical protein VFY14_12675 [Streptomyces sp.]|nr:hypothetical protein [Streptomyces sp.]